MAIIAIVLGVVAAIVLGLLVAGGVGIFALRQNLFEVQATVEANEVVMPRRATVIAQALSAEQVEAMGLNSGAARETYNPLDAVVEETGETTSCGRPISIVHM